MNFALGHALSARELFSWFDIKRFKLKGKNIKEIYKDGHKKRLAAYIFTKSVELVINDIIENNTHFKIPTYGSNQPYLYMKRFTGETFKQAYKKGKWNDIDVFASNMSGYELRLRLQGKNRDAWEKPVYVGGYYKQRITELTNEGKLY